mgnify:CR=1 FL=1
MNNVVDLLQKHKPDSAALYAFLGARDIRKAWAARGGGYAGSVTQNGWAKFKEHLKDAEDKLSKAWQKDNSFSYPAEKMISVCMGQNYGLDKMNLWYERAIAADKDNVSAASAKILYLLPRWHGSEEAALKFARSLKVAAEEKKIDAQFAALLPQTHYHLWTGPRHKKSETYWQNKEVWKEIEASFKVIFDSLNGKNKKNLSWYAAFSWKCKKWKESDWAFKQMKHNIDYKVFFRFGVFGQTIEKLVRDKASALR